MCLAEPVQFISEHPPRPVNWPVMLQRWESLTFLHWRYQPDLIQRLIPPKLELDTFDGSAWVGLTPFLLTGLRPPGLPAFPWISRFPEMNVRTYVRGPDGERGIWFFSLEADRLAAVLGARFSYGLPYRWAKMKVLDRGTEIEYRSKRHALRGTARVVIGKDATIRPDDRERFLTARFRLYTRVAGRLAYAEVDHPPWPLQSATVLRLEQDVIQHSGVPAPSGEPLVHYSAGTSVRIGRPMLV